MMGWSLIIFTQVVTVSLWLIAKAESSVPSLATGTAQILGLLGMVTLSWTFVLAMRHKVIEAMFGGLDKVYKVHHIMGGMAFVLLINHVLLLIVGTMPANTLKLYLVPGTSLDYTMGQLALYTMFILLSLTLYIKLPYRFWKWSHEWMGLVIIFGGLHAILVASDTARYMPLRYWIIGVSTLATLAFLYKRFGYYYFPSGVNYKIVTSNRQGDLLVIKMESLGKAIYFGAGQYGFFSIDERKRDEHPFSILGSEGKVLIVGIKMVGSFTKSMGDLAPENEVVVRGPYGLFGEKMAGVKHAVWIAGGIGITPFLSMAREVGSEQRVEMYFCARVLPPPVITESFARLSERNPRFTWLPCDTSKGGRLTGRRIYNDTGCDKYAHYLLCGPKEMMESIAEQLAEIGVARSRIIYEDFAFK